MVTNEEEEEIDNDRKLDGHETVVASPLFSFVGQLTPVQQEVHDGAIQILMERHGHGGILQLPCGFGKTVITLYMIVTLLSELRRLADRRQKVLVVVHKDFLLNQWKTSIETFLPDARVGILKQKTVQVEGCDIVIGMLQSIVSCKYENSIMDQFGIAVFDECHHMGAKMFSSAFFQINTKFVVGLSATPHRKDGLSKVFEWFIGPVLVSRQRQLSQQVTIMRAGFSFDESLDDLKILKMMMNQLENSSTFRVRLISFLCNSASRNSFIVRETLALLDEHADRRVLVLSERRQHLDILEAEVKQRFLQTGLVNHSCTAVELTGFYRGGLKQTALDEAATKRVIFGTYQMASEGMDLPALNAVILSTPKGDVEQSVGRMLRKDHPSVCPLAIDIVDDNVDICRGMFFKRRRFYHRSNFLVQTTSSLSDDLNEMDIMDPERNIDHSRIDFV